MGDPVDDHAVRGISAGGGGFIDKAAKQVLSFCLIHRSGIPLTVANRKRAFQFADIPSWPTSAAAPAPQAFIAGKFSIIVHQSCAGAGRSTGP